MRTPFHLPALAHLPVGILLGALALFLVGCGPAEEPAVEDVTPDPTAPPGEWAFVNANVIPMEGPELLPDHTVIVRDGRVVEVGPSGEVVPSEEAQIIEADGGFLIPGLAEMHAHISPDPETPRQEMEDMLFLFAANGVTTIRGMLGAPHQLELRDAIASREVLGPRFVVAAPSLRGATVPTPEDAERLVQEYAAAGYDLLKIHPGIERDVWDHLVEVAREEGITFAGHVPADVGIRHALETGISTVDHLDGYLDGTRRDDLAEGASPLETFQATDPQKVEELVSLTRESGARMVPTMYLWENFFDPVDVDSVMALPEMRYAPPEMREGWAQMNRNRWANQMEQDPDADWVAVGRAHADARVEILRALHEGGVEVLLGTDAPQMFNVPGFAIHREIPIMERAGMSPLEILESGSRAVARYLEEGLGLPGDFGTVAPGQWADLVLLRENPLEDLAHLQGVEGVMLRGEWLSGEEIRQRLEDMAQRFES